MKCIRTGFPILILVFIAVSGLAQQSAVLPYQNTALSPEARAADLVSRMTLREKLSQLFNHAEPIDRLGVPAYDWWNEALHGVARAGKATVFPQAIGLAASFNESLLLNVATAISDEGRAKHHFFLKNNIRSIYTGLTFWSPNINIFRDPRWGRGQETYGEDPFLTGRLAVNFINGLQGNDPRYLKTIATAKHYAVHSGPEFSRHQDNIFVNDFDLYQTYLPAFKATIKEAHVQSVMCAYNRLRDQPCCGSNLLLSNILRGRFGFNGYVVSDCGAITDFYNTKAHHVTETPARAMGWSLAAGTDLNCEESKAFLPDNIDSAVQAGIVNERDINTSLIRTFKARFMLGMFDPEEQVPYARIPMTVVGNQAHLDLALKAAQESIVLLKNDGILPLKNVRKVALIGPNADNEPMLLGNYNGDPIKPVTPLQALRRQLGASNVFYTPGCAITEGVYTNYETIAAGQLFHLENGKRKSGLKAEYFANTKWEGTPALVRTDNTIHFYWEKSPVNGKMEDEFSVRWTGVLVPSKAGLYYFGGNLKLNLDGQPVKEKGINLESGRAYQLEATLSVKGTGWANTINPSAELSWVYGSRDYRKEALEAAAKADVVIFCGGISAQLEGEEMWLEIDGFSHGDRTHLNLPASQEALLKELKQTGKKIVYVNFSGSAVSLNWEAANLDAIVQAFYPGEAGGTALVNTLFGASNPSGRLPVTFYKSVDDLPAFKDYGMNGRTYRYFKGEPLYPFGYGLSYSRFSYKDLGVPATLACGDSLSVMVSVTNTGTMDGDEVVQVYLSRTDTAFQAPLRSLVAFKKVFLKAGETQQVTLTIKRDQLAVIDGSFQHIIAPGKITISAGGTQPGRQVMEGQVLQSSCELTGSAFLLEG